MKRIALMVLAGVLALSAVQWDIEQITDEADLWSTDPILVLDAQWHPHILFTQWNEEVHIKVASHDTDLWVIDEVATVSEDFMPYYSIDVDSEGNTLVAYTDWVEMANADIFVASDEEGEFVSVNVTDDELFQAAPVIKLDHEDIPHIIYAEAVTPEDEIKICHGWADAEGFHSEEIVDNMYQDDYLGYDLVFDPLHIPHVFYIGDDDHLWHTTSGEPAWIPEQLNELSSEWPSAVADPLGSFHVAYDVGGSSIHYITNMTGVWQDELVSDLGDPEGGNERPSLALEIVYGSYLGIGNPHVVWLRPDELYWPQIWYASKKTGSWAEEIAISSGFDQGAEPGYGRYFAIDSEGYGHLVYSMYDYGTGFDQILYAKSKEPLIGGITENPPQSTPLSLKVRGSTIRFSLPNASSIRLDLYDAAGRRVECIASGSYAAGKHSIPINSDGLPTGVYFIRMEAGGHSACAKFAVTH